MQVQNDLPRVRRCTASRWPRVICDRRPPKCVAAVALLLACTAAVVQAQEIKTFQLTGVEGYATTRFLSDEILTSQPGSPQTRQSQTDLRQEIFFMSHSYAYHPNFVSLDIGGGPILERQKFVDESGDTQSQGAQYNFTGRATFLRDKPYRGSVFYDHLNPTVSVAPGQTLTMQNTRYGFDFSLLAPVTPVPIYIDANRSHFQGRGADRIVDDQVDRMNLRATRSFGALGTSQFQYQNTRQESTSGSPNLPIQASSSTSESYNLDSRFQFGGNRQYDLVNLVSYNTQNYALGLGPFPDRKDSRFFLDLRGRHSDQVQTFGNYNFSSRSQGDLAYTLNAVAAGVTYLPRKDLTATLGVRGEDNRTNQFTAQLYGVDGSARYQRPFLYGDAQASYGVRYDVRDQTAVAGQTSVIGERVVLVGTAYSSLARQHVVGSSVVVNNLTRTQTFVQGIDYTLSVIGVETRLQRLIGGNILDGQEVLVDYNYDVGGTYAYTQTDQTLNLGWNMRNYVNVYYRYFDSAPQLTSGTPTFQLNTIRSNLFGARADVPLASTFEFLVGGSWEAEDRQETISPFHRQAEDVYVQTDEPFFDTGKFRLATRRLQIDYSNSIQNVNLTGYDFRYWSRHWFGLDVTADATYERDTGSPIPRSRLIGAFKAQWRYNKASLTFDAGHTRETQGSSDRSRTLVQLLLRRDF
jgi:hypothetical protein